MTMKLLRRDPADRWASVFGRVAVYSFVAALITGVLLLPYFRPSMATVIYHGSYAKLNGVPMSQAYASTLGISFDVRAGLLVRQVHHWSALVFVAAVCLRLGRTFFRGKFSGRHLPDWLIWVTLIPMGMVAGLTGTILPDDMLSGGSLSVFTGVIFSIPLIGTHLGLWLFGGSIPGHVIIPRDYWVHVAVIPAVIALLLVLSYRPQLRIQLRLPRVHLPAPRLARLRNIDPLLPFTCAVLILLGAIAQINPVWLYGPYVPGGISAGSVPDWYMGFVDGALRIMPGWEFTVGGHPVTLAVLVPGVIVPGMFFTFLAGYPLLDGKITGRRSGQNGPVGPSEGDPANRIAAGAAVIAFYCLLWAAAANDEIALHLHLALYTVTWIFRVLVPAGPVAAFAATRVLCHVAADRRRDEAEHGIETGIIRQDPDGGFHEIHRKAA